MKLFYKKDYELATEIIEDLQVLLDEANEEVDYLNSSFKELSKKYGNLCKKNCTNNLLNRDLKSLINLREKEIADLEKKVKQLNGAKGGLTKRNNALLHIFVNLKEENRNLKKRIIDLESNRYVKIELPPEKPRKVKVMGIRRGVVSKGAKAILKSKNESEEKN